MKKPRTKSKNLLPQSYDVNLMEQIEAQLAPVREMTQLTTELRACVSQIERSLRAGKTFNVTHFPQRLH